MRHEGFLLHFWLIFLILVTKERAKDQNEAINLSHSAKQQIQFQTAGCELLRQTFSFSWPLKQLYFFEKHTSKLLDLVPMYIVPNMKIWCNWAWKQWNIEKLNTVVA